MAQDDDSQSSVFKNVCCKLMIFALGFVCCSVMTVLSYFTYQSVFQKISICTLWTDIPGRLVIFSFCYYGASICGCLPIPDVFRLECLPEPFVLWKIESWRKLSRNIMLPLFSFSFNIFKRKPRNPERISLLKDQEEHFYDCLPREPPEPADIIYPENYRNRPSQPIRIPKVESPGMSGSSEESFMSFDSPVGGHIVPMAKRKSSKPRYLPESVYRPGTPVGPVETTPPRTPEDFLFPEYPRVPWEYLTQSGCIPTPVKGIHRKNLDSERKEARKHTRKHLKEERKRKAGIDYKPSKESFESEGEADDDIKALLNPLSTRVWNKSPHNTRQRKSQGRLRKTHNTHTKSTSGMSSQKQSIEEYFGMAAYGDVTDKTGKKDERLRRRNLSPTLQYQLDCIKEFFARLGENMQTGAQQLETKHDTKVEGSRKTNSPKE